MVSKARKQKLLAKRQARNRERGARAAVIAAAAIDQHDKKLLSMGLSPSDAERCMLDRRTVLEQARKQACEDLKIEKRHRKAQQAQRESAFLRLPAEARCLIYEHLFADKRMTITADSSMLDPSMLPSFTSDTRPLAKRERKLRRAWALTAVCRTVRREVLQMMPKLSELAVEFDGRGRLRMDDFDRWLTELGALRTSQLRRLVLVGRNKCTAYQAVDGNDPKSADCTRTVQIDLSNRRTFCLKSSCVQWPGRLSCGFVRDTKMAELLERVTGGAESGRLKVLDRGLLNEVYSWLNSFVQQ